MKVSNTSGSEEVSSASISNLPNDLLKYCFSFIPGSYITVAPVSRQFHRNYCTQGMDDSLTVLSTDSILKIGKNRRTTVDAVSNDVNLTEYCFINKAPEDFMIKVCQRAATKRRTDILECANIFGTDFGKVREKGVMYDNLIEFAKQGNLEMIQYFEHNKLLEDIDCDDWSHVFTLAKESDHLRVMKWIFDEKSHHLIDDSDDETYYRSTIKAYEHILEGVQTNEVTFECLFGLCEVAARKGNIEVLEYCNRSNHPFEAHTTSLYINSMMNKDKEQALETLEWLRRHGCPLGGFLCHSAALNNNLEALKYARNNNCHWSEVTLCEAVKTGNLAMIEYCLENDCPMAAEVCAYAMWNKDHKKAIEALKLLRKYSCPWTERTCDMAIFFGHFEAMRWAKGNGCPWTENEFYSLLRKGNISIIEEFLQDEPRHDTNRIFQEALSNESSNDDSKVIDKLKLLHRYGYRWDANTTLEAAKQGRLQVLQWLRYIGCDLDVDSCIAAVRSKKNTDVLKYLQGITD
ncbi:hypothetical protein CTEN210_04120 [Chaetoceros tenuissimus]|uniref:Uncharacterized protein n=1 Tax=Chaetoceros tenuissimus TaxID=426638 RepID=A0AAD3H273_9STRA|nr:hypothetical protein CTEN210_04120 [Chaetoceros tenuissimus]